MFFPWWMGEREKSVGNTTKGSVALPSLAQKNRQKLNPADFWCGP
jgi:hypothetical protein